MHEDPLLIARTTKDDDTSYDERHQDSPLGRWPFDPDVDFEDEDDRGTRIRRILNILDR